MTGSDTNDPRTKLKPGFTTRVKQRWASSISCWSKSPTRFNSASDDPNDPKVQKTLGQMGASASELAKMPKPVQLVTAQLAFANSDLAFQGNHLFLGNFYGMSIYDISNPAKPSVVDYDGVSGWTRRSVGLQKPALHVGGNAERPPGLRNAGISAAASAAFAGSPDREANQFTPPPAQKDRFRGVRIFDISDIKNPKQVAAVQTCRGSHTHTLVVDPNDKDNVYIYVSGTSFVRQSEELAGCSGETPDKDPNTALISHRSDQGAAREAAGCEGRLESATIYGSADGRAERAE